MREAYYLCACVWHKRDASLVRALLKKITFFGSVYCKISAFPLALQIHPLLWADATIFIQAKIQEKVASLRAMQATAGYADKTPDDVKANDMEKTAGAEAEAALVSHHLADMEAIACEM